VLCFWGYHRCSHIMVSLCFVSEVMIPSETKQCNTILWEQLWYLRKQSTAIPYDENSYDTLGNKAQRYHNMRTPMIPSETKHSNTILWEQLRYPRKQSTAIPYYENRYDTLGNKAQQYHIAVLCFRGYHNFSHSMVLLCFVSEGIITVLIVWYCCALFPRVS
jgi:hypothetical protein